MPSEREIAEFWRDADHYCGRTGCSEAELLKRFPSYRGTKPGTKPPQARAQVVPMPPPMRDRKMLAAGDYDDAA